MTTLRRRGLDRIIRDATWHNEKTYHWMRVAIWLSVGAASAAAGVASGRGPSSGAIYLGYGAALAAFGRFVLARRFHPSMPLLLTMADLLVLLSSLETMCDAFMGTEVMLVRILDGAGLGLMLILGLNALRFDARVSLLTGGAGIAGYLVVRLAHEGFEPYRLVDAVLMGWLVVGVTLASHRHRRLLERIHGDMRALQDQRVQIMGRLVAGVTHELNSPLGSLRSGLDTMARASRTLAHEADGEARPHHGDARPHHGDTQSHHGEARPHHAEARAHEGEARPHHGDAGPHQGEARSADRASRATARAAKALEEASRVSHSSLERLERVIMALRSFARPDQSEWQEVDLHEGLDASLELLRGQALGQGLEVVKTYASDLPRVLGSPMQLNHVFLNLLENAAEAMGGRGRLVLETRSIDGQAVVRIRDSGPGISADQLEAVFEPSFIRRGARVKMGLGLAVSRSVAQDLGGDLRLESIRGEGTCAVLTLPPAPLSREQARETRTIEAMRATSSEGDEPPRARESPAAFAPRL